LYQKLVDRGVYGEKDASIFIGRVIQALDYLHREIDVIHRDLKPENILLVDDLTPKLIDFGISKLFGPNADIDSTSRVFAVLCASQLCALACAC
jgi:serine/threonine protein kinase